MPLASITALDVALVSSIAALSAAIISPLVAWITTSARSRHERWLRIYDDRRDAYLTMLSAGYRSISVLDTFTEALEKNDPGVDLPVDEPGPPHVIQARVGLFARPGIDRELGAFEEARLSALGEMLTGDLTTDEGRALIVARVRPAIADLETRLETVRKALHDDLARI